MKKLLLSATLVALTAINFAQTSATISTSGFTYTPASLTVNHGDTIFWDFTANHPTTEVDSTSWANDVLSALPGGFNPNPGDTLIIDTNIIVPGIHYYVCDNHVASSSMKGTITVNSSPGATVGVVNNEKLTTSIFPNPVINNLNVILKNEGIANVTVYDINSKIVNTLSTNKSQFSIDFTGLNNGTYFLSIEKNGIINKEVIVKQ